MEHKNLFYFYSLFCAVQLSELLALASYVAYLKFEIISKIRNVDIGDINQKLYMFNMQISKKINAILTGELIWLTATLFL